MKDTFKTIYILVSVLILVSGCSGNGEQGGVNQPAPLFTMQDIHGDTVSLKDLRGKVVLLSFFATWCGPCRQEVPEFIRIYEKLKDDGLEIVAIGLDAEGARVLRSFARDHQIPYPIVPGTRNVVLDYGGIESIPTTFVIDHHGRVAEYFVGWRPASRLEESVERLLQKRV